MAGPGDHQGQDGAGHDDPDAEVGFCTPDSLAGRPRVAPEPFPAPFPEPVPEPVPAPVSAPEPEPEFAFEPAPAAAPAPAWDAPEAVIPVSAPFVAEAPAPAAEPSPVYGRRRTRPEPIEGETGLYAVYVMILLAVPTFGASAALGLLSMLGRAGPEQIEARSHFIYQRRTLFAAAIAALTGVILIVVGLGVFVLFALAIWATARGAYGVLRLKSGQPVERPDSWLF